MADATRNRLDDLSESEGNSSAALKYGGGRLRRTRQQWSEVCPVDPIGSVDPALCSEDPFRAALLIIVIPLVLMQVFSAYVFYDRHWDIMTRRLVHSLAGDIAFLIEDLDSPVRASQVRTLSDSARRHFDIDLYWQPNGILPNQPKSGWLDATADAMQEAMDAKVRRPYVMNTESIHRRIEILCSFRTISVVADKKRLFSSTTYIFLLWMVGSSSSCLRSPSSLCGSDPADAAFGRGGSCVWSCCDLRVQTRVPLRCARQRVPFCR